MAAKRDALPHRQLSAIGSNLAFSKKSRISSVDNRLSSSAVGNCAYGTAGTGEKQSLGCLREFNGEAGSFAVRASGDI